MWLDDCMNRECLILPTCGIYYILRDFFHVFFPLLLGHFLLPLGAGTRWVLNGTKHLVNQRKAIKLIKTETWYGSGERILNWKAGVLGSSPSSVANSFIHPFNNTCQALPCSGTTRVSPADVVVKKKDNALALVGLIFQGRVRYRDRKMYMRAYGDMQGSDKKKPVTQGSWGTAF